MKLEQIKSLIRDVPDFPKAGIVFKDITPVLSNAQAFSALITLMANDLKDLKVTQLAGIESRGFIFASALAREMNLGLTLIRKKGKLPWKTLKQSYQLEYGVDEIEIHADALKKGERIVIVDDVLATGGTAISAIKLCRQLGADVAAFSCFIELKFLKGDEILKPIPVKSLIQF